MLCHLPSVEQDYQKKREKPSIEPIYFWLSIVVMLLMFTILYLSALLLKPLGSTLNLTCLSQKGYLIL